VNTGRSPLPRALHGSAATVGSPLPMRRILSRPVFLCRRIIKQEAELMLANPRDAFTDHSRSLNMVPFDRLGMVSY